MKGYFFNFFITHKNVFLKRNNLNDHVKRSDYYWYRSERCKIPY